MDIPDQYYEGVAAESEDQCPYAWYELFDRCWWMAGFHDARRGMA